jgi:hypothetical protein
MILNVNSAFQNLNWAAVIIAAVSSFALGGLWYSPLLFAERWMKETGVNSESASRKNMGRTFGLSFILALVAAFFLALFIGKDAGAGSGALAGFMAGLGWVFTFLGITYLFESRSLVHFLINACFSILSLTIMGLIIGAWQ